MNRRIAEILKTFITPLNFADKVGGLVRVIQVDQSSGETRNVPGDYSLAQHQANIKDFVNYAPDASKRSIIYFEDEGTTIERDGARYIDLVSTIKLVAWFNLGRINRDLNECSQLMFLIMEALPKSFPNTDNILKARLDFQGQERGPEIFAPYDYDESILQHLMYPYDAGALTYNVIYSVRPECIADIVINPAECITNPNC